MIVKVKLFSIGRKLLKSQMFLGTPRYIIISAYNAAQLRNNTKKDHIVIMLKYNKKTIL